MSTIKLDHIELLIGATNYEGWQRGISQVLQGEGYWGHVEGDTNPFSPFPRSEQPASPNGASTPDEVLAFQGWWQKDSKARTIVERRILPVVLNLLPQGIGATAHKVWNRLKELYNHIDVMAQFNLREQMGRIRLKDHHDLDRYIGEFQQGCIKFIQMGVAYSESEMVHQILRGLPAAPSWVNFKQLMTQVVQDHLDSQANALIPPPADTLLNRVISRLDVECQRLLTDKVFKANPGSEYVNLADIPIRKSSNNPNGVLCSNCGIARLQSSLGGGWWHGRTGRQA